MTTLPAGIALVLACMAAGFFGTLALAFLGRIVGGRIQTMWSSR